MFNIYIPNSVWACKCYRNCYIILEVIINFILSLILVVILKYFQMF
jgi:hypothetical protein